MALNTIGNIAGPWKISLSAASRNSWMEKSPGRTIEEGRGSMENQRNEAQNRLDGGKLERLGDVIRSLPLKSTLEVFHEPVGQESEDAMADIHATNEDNVCPICKGAQFVYPHNGNGKVDYSRVVPCLCARAKLAEAKRHRMLRLCELPLKAQSWTFENFEVLPGLEEAYEAALELAEERGDSNWLTLMGGTDKGKSHLLAAVCHRWLQKGKPARYAYVPLLFDELRRGFGIEGDMSYEARWGFFINVPLLALDDLGTENRTPWVQERLDTIIDSRLTSGLALVVTTNLPMEDLPFRIRSRLSREGRVVYIAAPEYHSNPDRRAK